jgi:hypothetical protein
VVRSWDRHMMTFLIRSTILATDKYRIWVFSSVIGIPNLFNVRNGSIYGTLFFMDVPSLNMIWVFALRNRREILNAGVIQTGNAHFTILGCWRHDWPLKALHCPCHSWPPSRSVSDLLLFP